MKEKFAILDAVNTGRPGPNGEQYCIVTNKPIGRYKRKITENWFNTYGKIIQYLLSLLNA